MIVLLGCTAQGSTMAEVTPTQALATTVTYTATNAHIANPERGLYHSTETHTPDYELLDLDTLVAYRRDEAISLILREFYLEAFIEGPISQEYLKAMQQDFDTVRASGLKAIVRFAYTDKLPDAPPYGDATKAQILAHLDQLAPVLQANSDVIAVVQTGFIGVWGEWYYTDHFVANPSDPDGITVQDWANRREVVLKYLAILPPERMLQLRTVLEKRQIAEREVPITIADVQQYTNAGRIGLHNDCFLASDTDYGTYRDEALQEDQAYLAAESKYLPVGGETCALNPPRSECPATLADLARYHWSYLNLDYHPDVINGWSACMDTIKQKLGYRLALVQGIYPDQIAPGKTFSVEIDLRNDGWAAPFNLRQPALILRNQSSGAIQQIALADDPRTWQPGAIRLQHTLCAPDNLEPGEYDLLLSLPDPAPSLTAQPAHAIRLANEQVWEEQSGYNDLLHTITVTEAGQQDSCSKHVYLPLISKHRL